MLPSDLIEPKEAAKLIRRHISCIYRLIARGRLKAYKIAGARYVLSKADVAKLIEVVWRRQPG